MSMTPIQGIEQQRQPISEVFDESLAGETLYVKGPKDQNDPENFYFKIEKLNGQYFLSCSYYMGVDWVKDGIPIQILPKIDDAKGPVDYMKMLTDALKEPEDADYLDGLLSVDFNAPAISIPSTEDILSPFLVAQFILALKTAARKGLRRSYYIVTDNLKSKVKGRVMATKNISLNLSKGKKTDNYCQYLQYGLDSLENRLLKRALQVSSSILTQYRGGMDVRSLKRAIAQIGVYFREVSDEFDPAALTTHVGTDHVFRDYVKALGFAKLIIRRNAYGLGRNAKGVQSTPPYWIDMSKLFELYLLSKLREEYSRNEILYQEKIDGRIPDYLLIPKDGVPMVIDAKYKPRYHDGSVDFADVGQVSAYARMRGVHKRLGVDLTKTIPCLIIYAHQDCPKDIDGRIRSRNWKNLEYYFEIAKLGISLPIKGEKPAEILSGESLM